MALLRGEMDYLVIVDSLAFGSKGQSQYSSLIDPYTIGHCEPPMVAFYEICQNEFHRCARIYSYVQFHGYGCGSFVVNCQLLYKVWGHYPISAVFRNGNDRRRFRPLVLLRRIFERDGFVLNLVSFYGSYNADGYNFVPEIVWRQIPSCLFSAVAGSLDAPRQFGCHIRIPYSCFSHFFIETVIF